MACVCGLSVLVIAVLMVLPASPPVSASTDPFPTVTIPARCTRPYTPYPSQDVSQQIADVMASSDVSDDAGDLAIRYAKSLVVSRGLLFSMALQLLNETGQWGAQPGFLYHYLSAATALTAAPPALLGSGLFFFNHTHYPNWYRSAPFNSTLPLFAPHASRLTASEVRVEDYGADPTTNYTLSANKNTYYPTTIRTNAVKDKYGDISVKSFYAAPYDVMPAISVPRFECPDKGEGSWVVTLTFPVVDVLAKYVVDYYSFLRHPRYVAVTSADLDVAQLTSADVISEQVEASRKWVPSMQCWYQTPSPASRYVNMTPSFFRRYHPQARLALRLAHTLSAFLQNSHTLTSLDLSASADVSHDPYMPPPTSPSAQIKVESGLHEALLEAEVLSTVLADSSIWSAGIFFSRQANDTTGSITSPTRAFMAYGPSSYSATADQYGGEDMSSGGQQGFTASLLDRARGDWGHGETLTTFTYHPAIRASASGGGLADFAVDPLSYRAAAFTQGTWTPAYYKCEAVVTGWVVSYAAPFFGPSPSHPSKLELRGVVAVDITLPADSWTT